MKSNDKSKKLEHIETQHAFFDEFTKINPKINYQIISGVMPTIVIYFSTEFFKSEIDIMLNQIIIAYKNVFKKDLSLIRNYPIAIPHNEKYDTICYLLAEQEYSRAAKTNKPITDELVAQIQA